MSQDKYAYLGKAENFPTTITSTGGITLVAGFNLIKQSIIRILETGLGTVFFNRSWGSRLRNSVYEPNDDMLISQLDLFIQEAIEEHEKRVEYISTDYAFFRTVDKNWVQCTINVRILQSNEIDSLVWPFYRNS